MIPGNKVRLYFFLFLCLVPTLLTSCLNGTSSTDTQNIIRTARSFNDLETFVSLVDSAGLTDTLSESGPFTAFTPTDDAFSQVPDSVWDSMSKNQLDEVLQYHIVEDALYANSIVAEQTIESMQGEDLYIVTTSDSIHINSGNIVGFNIPASNGVIHAIDVVLLPDSYLNVTGIIAKRYTLSAFEDSLKKTGLINTLENDPTGEYTIFAPADSAFENHNLPEGQQLQEILRYHVIPRKLLSEDLNSQSYETLNGEEVTIEVDGNSIIINGESAVTTSDLEGTNGVVHIIDTLLEPPSG